jgi:preprotein translocase subunit SecG
MFNINTFLDILIIINSIILIVLIILQQRGSNLSTFFGSWTSFNFTQRRGVEKYIYKLTWILVILFLLLSFVRMMKFF